MRYLNLFFMAMLVMVGIAEANDTKTKENNGRDKSSSEKVVTEKARQALEKEKQPPIKASRAGNECF